MSKSFKPLGQNSLLGIVFMVFLIAGPITALSQSDEMVPFAIEIGSSDLALLGSNVSIPVTKTAGSQPILGFDFLIGYDGYALTFLDAVPGDLYDDPGDYEWEYFTFRYTQNGDCGSGCPSGLVRAVGVADENDGNNHPLETMVPDGMVLFNLNFIVTGNPAFEGLFIPIRFYWMDCGDNAVSYEDSSFIQLALSHTVTDYDGADITDTLAGFPTYYGSMFECFSGPNFPEHFIDFYNGGVNIMNSDFMYVHWGDTAEFDAPAVDPDTTNACEDLTFTMLQGPSSAELDYLTGNFFWPTTGDDVCYTMILIEIADVCGATSEYAMGICVTNDPPQATDNPNDTIYAGWGITISQQVEASDPDNGPDNLGYRIISFSGPTWYGSGLQIDSVTGIWNWDIGEDHEYLGDFVLTIKISDGADICGGCNSENADIAYYNIHVIGHMVTISKVHDQLQGQYAEVSISLDSAYLPDTFTTFLIGGFDFLIAYDASVLTAMSAEPGALIDNGKFEYFSYRFGPFGGCDDGCPSGMLRVVSMREENDGVPNDYHLTTPGELVKLNFHVTSDTSYEGQFTPIQFYWLDCGDNTIADESGDWLFLGSKVYSPEVVEINDPGEIFGYSGPEANCYDTVYHSDETYNNAPMGSIAFRNGGIDIIPTHFIDDRGDVNLNGVQYEIADAIVFMNYFFQGLAAFTINVEGQIAATDINGDGIVLTLQDLVYLFRIIDGTLLPISSPNKGPEDSFDGKLFLTESDSSIVIRSNFEDSVAALRICFYAPDLQTEDDYEIVVSPDVEHMYVGYNILNDSLIIMIYHLWSDSASVVIDSGFIDLVEFVYTGEKPQFNYASAAGFLAEYVNLTIYDLPDTPPILNPYPTQMTNDFYGGFEYQFSAYYPFKSSNTIEFYITSGPGEIDPETGLWKFAPLCADSGTTYALEICVSDPLHPCSPGDSTQTATVELNIVYEPPMVGDANGSGDMTIEDIVYVIVYKYLSGAEPVPSYRVADVNADGVVNIFDMVYLIYYILLNGPEPVCP